MYHTSEILRDISPISYLHVRRAGDDAALLDPLDEGVAGSIIGDGQTERLLRLHDLDLFGLTCRRRWWQWSIGDGHLVTRRRWWQWSIGDGHLVTRRRQQRPFGDGHLVTRRRRWQRSIGDGHLVTRRRQQRSFGDVQMCRDGSQ